MSRRRCEGKQAYVTEGKAIKVAQMMSKREGELLIAYQCPDCLRFHVGHADKTQILIRGTTAINEVLNPAPAPATKKKKRKRKKSEPPFREWPEEWYSEEPQ